MKKWNSSKNHLVLIMRFNFILMIILISVIGFMIFLLFLTHCYSLSLWSH